MTFDTDNHSLCLETLLLWALWHLSSWVFSHTSGYAYTASFDSSCFSDHPLNENVTHSPVFDLISHIYIFIYVFNCHKNHIYVLLPQNPQKRQWLSSLHIQPRANSWAAVTEDSSPAGLLPLTVSQAPQTPHDQNGMCCYFADPDPLRLFVNKPHQTWDIIVRIVLDPPFRSRPTFDWSPRLTDCISVQVSWTHLLLPKAPSLPDIASNKKKKKKMESNANHYCSLPQNTKGWLHSMTQSKMAWSLFTHPFPQKIDYFSQHRSWAISLKTLKTKTQEPYIEA